MHSTVSLKLYDGAAMRESILTNSSTGSYAFVPATITTTHIDTSTITATSTTKASFPIAKLNHGEIANAMIDILEDDVIELVQFVACINDIEVTTKIDNSTIMYATQFPAQSGFELHEPEKITFMGDDLVFGTGFLGNPYYTNKKYSASFSVIVMMVDGKQLTIFVRNDVYQVREDFFKSRSFV